MTTTTKTSKIFRTWQERIDSGVFTHSLCRQFAANVTRQACGEDAAGFKSNLTPGEAYELFQELKVLGVSLTPAHEKQGLEWLRKHGVKGMEMPQDVIDLFSHFVFHGRCELTERGAIPVWRIVLTDGRQIDYYWGAWQDMAWNGRDRCWGWWWV